VAISSTAQQRTYPTGPQSADKHNNNNNNNNYNYNNNTRIETRWDGGGGNGIATKRRGRNFPFSFEPVARRTPHNGSLRFSSVRLCKTTPKQPIKHHVPHAAVRTHPPLLCSVCCFMPYIYSQKTSLHNSFITHTHIHIYYIYIFNNNIMYT
jgi:hypothetical protein